jgi:hypothetical protein
MSKVWKALKESRMKEQHSTAEELEYLHTQAVAEAQRLAARGRQAVADFSIGKRCACHTAYREHVAALVFAQVVAAGFNPQQAAAQTVEYTDTLMAALDGPIKAAALVEVETALAAALAKHAGVSRAAGHGPPAAETLVDMQDLRDMTSEPFEHNIGRPPCGD